ncbi:hypothetical protein LAD77_00190 [Klebsiella pneumoniae]|nr:hypothetical protein [Klebsiella pneumoniae]
MMTLLALRRRWNQRAAAPATKKHPQPLRVLEGAPPLSRNTGRCLTQHRSSTSARHRAERGRSSSPLPKNTQIEQRGRYIHTLLAKRATA